MPLKLNSTIAVIGIDIGKNSFHAMTSAVRLYCDKSGRVARWKRGLRTCSLAWSGWRPESARIILVESCRCLDSCRNKSRQATARSWAAYQSAAIAICAHCLFRQLGLSW